MTKHAADTNEDASTRSVDLLSKLPEHNLNQILCFLSQKEAVRTCVLSKSWRYRGSTRTELELSQTGDFERDEQSFFSVIDNTLQWYNDQNLCVKQLTLKMLKFREGYPEYDLLSMALNPKFLRELHLDGFVFRHISCTHRQHFPRLEALFLKHQKMSSESFHFFTSSYMPSLVDLELEECYGFEEFLISSSSVKHLKITRTGVIIKATVDAPNIVYFKLKVLHLPSICFTPTSGEWKLDINLPFSLYRNTNALPRTLELNEVLKSLTQSQITLQLQNYSSMWDQHLLVEDNSYFCFYKPLVVENLSLRGFHSSPIVPIIFNYFFRVCRPRYIYDADGQDRRELIENLSKVLLHERERRGYFWNQDLVDVSMETSCVNANEWPNKQMIRLRLKWKE